MNNISDVKQRLDIVDVISGYLSLVRAGRYFKAACPFHEEKTPSFFVFPEKQSWRCFGCGAGGDLFAFIMKREGVDFSQALKQLADRAGVTLAPGKREVERKPDNRLYEANEAAAKYFHSLLLESEIAAAALAYVTARGLDRKTIQEFQLGFSPGEGLKKHLIELGYREDELLAAGLLKERNGNKYEFFRHRLMFPIRDVKKRLVGFGGRALEDSAPKYLNSPQTVLFDKSGVLYGIDRASAAIRETKLAVIVEGYMDVIMAHQHGMTNVLGSMGTALTEKQIRTLKELTRNVAFALDPDVAGNAATLRGIEVARRSFDRGSLQMPSTLGATSTLKADLRIIALPEGKDPDNVIRESPEQWRQLVKEALPLMDHLMNVISSKVDLTRPEGKSLASEQLLPLVAEMEDETQREYYLGKLAALLGVSERTLLNKASDLMRTRNERTSKTRPRIASVTRFGDRLEEYCLALLLQHPELPREIGRLLPEYFERTENREIFAAMQKAPDVRELTESVDPDLRGHLESLLSKGLPPDAGAKWEIALADCIRRLEERWLLVQEEFVTLEFEPFAGQDAAAAQAQRELLEQRAREINSRLTRAMRERAESGLGKERLDGQGT